MKTLSTMAFFLMLAFAGCASSYQKQSRDITFVYEAFTRGSYKKATVTQEGIQVAQSRDGKDLLVKGISSEDWNKLLKLLEKVPLDNIQNFKAPTDKRLYDGAMIASLKIKVGDKEYAGSSFDHGFPPEEIKEITNRITALAFGQK